MFYRFQKDDMDRLLHALEIPDHYICSQGTSSSGMESLMIMLRRLSYPNTLYLFTRRSSRSLHALPVNSTGFSLVLTARLRILATCSHSEEVFGFLDETSVASIISLVIEGHLKGAIFYEKERMMNDNTATEAKYQHGEIKHN